MASKSRKKTSGKHRTSAGDRKPAKPAPFRTPQTGMGGEANLFDNKPAIVGFAMSVLALAVHAAWILIVRDVVISDEAKEFDTQSAQAWVIVILIGVGVVLTLMSMVICLRAAGVKRRPRRLAILGFCLSFFIGSSATAIMIIGAMASQAGG